MESILLYLAIGILAGHFLFPRKKRNFLLRCGRYLQSMGVCISLFIMGITLGREIQNGEGLLHQGVIALGFAFSAVAGSGVFSWLLGRWAGWVPPKRLSKSPLTAPNLCIPEGEVVSKRKRRVRDNRSMEKGRREKTVDFVGSGKDKKDRQEENEHLDGAR